MEFYSRHKDLLGEAGFDKISKASVLVAGAGGLGSTVLSLLVRLGVGTVHFYEFDSIDISNLNRQLLYNFEDIGTPKSEKAKDALNKINPETTIIAHNEKITEQTKIPDVDLVFDCLDNFSSRYILDDLIYPRGIPMVHAGVSTYYGQLTFILPGKTDCLRKVMPLDAEKFDGTIDRNIFPPVVTTLASLQVSEGVKYLRGDFKNLLIKKLLLIDLLSNSFDIIQMD